MHSWHSFLNNIGQNNIRTSCHPLLVLLKWIWSSVTGCISFIQIFLRWHSSGSRPDTISMQRISVSLILIIKIKTSNHSHNNVDNYFRWIIVEPDRSSSSYSNHHVHQCELLTSAAQAPSMERTETLESCHYLPSLQLSTSCHSNLTDAC